MLCVQNLMKISVCKKRGSQGRRDNHLFLCWGDYFRSHEGILS